MSPSSLTRASHDPARDASPGLIDGDAEAEGGEVGAVDAEAVDDAPLVAGLLLQQLHIACRPTCTMLCQCRRLNGSKEHFTASKHVVLGCDKQTPAETAREQCACKRGCMLEAVAPFWQRSALMPGWSAGQNSSVSKWI